MLKVGNIPLGTASNRLAKQAGRRDSGPGLEATRGMRAVKWVTIIAYKALPHSSWAMTMTTIGAIGGAATTWSELPGLFRRCIHIYQSQNQVKMLPWVICPPSGPHASQWDGQSRKSSWRFRDCDSRTIFQPLRTSPDSTWEYTQDAPHPASHPSESRRQAVNIIHHHGRSSLSRWDIWSSTINLLGHSLKLQSPTCRRRSVLYLTTNDERIYPSPILDQRNLSADRGQIERILT